VAGQAAMGTRPRVTWHLAPARSHPDYRGPWCSTYQRPPSPVPVPVGDAYDTRAMAAPVADVLRGKTATAGGVDAAHARPRGPLSRDVPWLAGHVNAIQPGQLGRWCDDLRAAAVPLGEMAAVADAHRSIDKRPPAASAERGAATEKRQKGRSAPRT
jgi:hypothetical protein